MRRWIGYVALVMAVAFLASVPAMRSCERRQLLNPKYDAALYWGHIDAVDAETGRHVDFDVTWDFEGRSPFIKGSPPSVVETLSDGSKVVSIVGVYKEAPLVVTVKAAGYHSKELHLRTMRGGILFQSHDRVREVVILSRIDAERATDSGTQ